MRFLLSLSLLVFSSPFVWSQTASSEVVRVQIDSPAKFRAGAPVRAHTVEPLYENNKVVIPAGTPIQGEIVQVNPASHKRRLNAKFHGDFTPLHEVKVRFERVLPPNAPPVPISAAVSDESSSVVVFHSAGAKHVSLIHRAWSMALGKKNQAVSTFTAPGKQYRLEQMLFSQLPWHPESLQPGTEYDVALLRPLGAQTAMADPPRASKRQKLESSTELHARLLTGLTSAKAKPGDPVTAVVTQPKMDAANHVEIPQGTLLEGNVLQASPAGKWGRNGALRFTFHKMEFPEGAQQFVTGVPTAVAGRATANIQLDSEGGARPQSNRALLAPLSLGLLATSALTEDEANVTHAATSSNGFGLIGRIIAISTGSNIMGGTLGGIAAGRSVYSHFIAHGKDVVFPRNTEIQVDLGPSRKPMAVPAAN
ncbi:MAG: hypothetical protein ROO76_21975 [Terriglobia bacterium]|jgi:hypothetical protein|nr:hypothetical protein [Terriglobia bacterium]